MTQQWMLYASEFSVIAYALVAGVFLTFSDFVMRSLAATQPAGGIEAMQLINRKVFRTLFMVLLIGMAVVSPIMAAFAIWQEGGPAATCSCSCAKAIGRLGLVSMSSVLTLGSSASRRPL